MTFASVFQDAVSNVFIAMLSADSIIDGNGSRQSNGLIKTRMRYALRFDGFFKAWAGRLE